MFDSNRNLHCSQTDETGMSVTELFDSNRNLHCSQTQSLRRYHNISLTLIVIYIALKPLSRSAHSFRGLTLIVIYIALKPVGILPSPLVSLTLIVIYIALKRWRRTA